MRLAQDFCHRVRPLGRSVMARIAGKLHESGGDVPTPRRMAEQAMHPLVERVAKGLGRGQVQLDVGAFDQRQRNGLAWGV